MTKRCRLLSAALGAALALAAGDSRADDPSPAPEVEIPAPEEPAPSASRPAAGEDEAFTGAAARRDWNDRHRWHYGTQNLYPLTRGLGETGIPAWARWPLYPFTAVLDTGNLVFGAIGGLYGD